MAKAFLNLGAVEVAPQGGAACRVDQACRNPAARRPCPDRPKETRRRLTPLPGSGYLTARPQHDASSAARPDKANRHQNGRILRSAAFFAGINDIDSNNADEGE